MGLLFFLTPSGKKTPLSDFWVVQPRFELDL